MRLFLYFILCIHYNAPVFAQSNYDFHLLDKINESDFNYAGMDSINYYIGKNQLLNSVFNTKKGDYDVYRFIRTSTGEAKINDNSIRTELILIKVEPLRNKIIEAIYFPLDWKELPLNEVLIKSFPSIKMIKKTRVKNLKLDGIDNGNLIR